MTDSSRRKKRIIITAGATREYIDPVRFITNASTGVMGLELAREALRQGLKVSLIKTPSVREPVPEGIEAEEVETSSEMAQAVLEKQKSSDCLIMAAAVSNFTPRAEVKTKIKKKGRYQLGLEKTTDILKAAGKSGDLIKVGFALETENLENSAFKKLKGKKLSFIVGNLKTPGHDPFGAGKKDFVIISSEGEKERFSEVTKAEMAKTIIAKVKTILDGRT